MTDHYEMPHRSADECPHAGVGKACRPCRERFERDPNGTETQTIKIEEEFVTV